MYIPRARHFKNEDLIIEKDFGAPILQVGCERGLVNVQASGGAVTNPNHICMAILQSRKLIIAHMVVKDDLSEIKEIHVHEFTRNAFNFMIGVFG